MRPRQPRSTLVASRKNPALTKDGVREQFEELVKSAPYYVDKMQYLSVAQDLLLEQGMTLAEVSEASMEHLHPDLAKAMVDMGGRGGVFWVGDENERTRPHRASGTVTGGDDFVQWRVTPKPKMGSSTGWRVFWNAVIWGDDFEEHIDLPHPTQRHYTRDEATSYAVGYAWYMVKVIVKMFDEQPSDIWKAIEDRRWANADLVVTPSELDPKYRQNPFITDPKVAEERFWEALADPDPASMDIALDALEEGGLIDDLAGVSERRADPEWLNESKAGPYAGVFEFGTIGVAPKYDHKPGWWSFPAERARRLNNESYAIVEWWVNGIHNTEPPRYTHEVYYWRGKEGWGDLKDSEVYNSAEDARDAAVEMAWRVVQILKQSPTMKSNRVAAAVFRKPAQFSTRPASNPASGKRVNPAELLDLDRIGEILRDPDPHAAEVALDLILQAESSVSEYSRQVVPEWSAGWEQSGGAGGVFVLSGPAPTVSTSTSGWTRLEGDIKNAVSWYVVPIVDDRSKQFGINVTMWHHGYRYIAWDSPEYDYAGGDQYSREGAIRRAIIEAWRCVIAMKLEPSIGMTELGQRLKDRNWPPDWWRDLRINPEDNSMLTNPCACEPKQNPAWVTKHLADSWVTLEQKVPTKWLPKLDHTVAKGKRLSAEIPEYGCGAYGCVFPTNDPKIVLKLTTDDTEAQFAARLANQLPVPIVTKYELVMHLPTAKRQGRDVYLLWREAADDVGAVDKVVGDKAEVAIDKQHKAAQAAFDKLARGEKADRELAVWQQATKDMGKVHELAWLADGMLRAFTEKGIAILDIHGGNLGRARGHWVISDPGHVVVIERHDSSGQFKTANAPK